MRAECRTDLADFARVESAARLQHCGRRPIMPQQSGVATRSQSARQRAGRAQSNARGRERPSVARMFQVKPAVDNKRTRAIRTRSVCRVADVLSDPQAMQRDPVFRPIVGHPLDRLASATSVHRPVNWSRCSKLCCKIQSESARPDLAKYFCAKAIMFA